MGLAFTVEEYRSRAARVRKAMAEKRLDVLLVADIASQLWLTGCEGWSFYVPQLVVLTAADEEPMWIGRAMDAPGARMTGYMRPDRIHAIPERYVQRADRHPADYIAEFLASKGFGRSVVGYESDAYFFTPRTFRHLCDGLPGARFVDCDLLVSWQRAVKSAAEVELMRRAARIAERTMRTAYDRIAVGTRQCDVVGEIYRTQIAGDPEVSGDLTGLCPIILAGKAGSTAHPIWSEERFKDGETVAIEVAGACRRYHSALCRTLQLGTPPRQVTDTAKAVEEGLGEVLKVVRPGITTHDVHAAWQRILDRYGLKKESRIGYSIGVGYPPDWGEHTISLRADETTVLESGNVLHIVLGMWSADFGLELSETVLVTASGAECLTSFPRDLYVK